ncbi:hypothetical protein M6B38_162690 [Iris pallida]|uniref:Uncharacterized protein n=1 Tax=Iris pallida TaxID=29817 RepID=A0AAX6EYZ4_IRIPA|nr:hypothetical protein M6B38_162690 [Iris pallida]
MFEFEAVGWNSQEDSRSSRRDGRLPETRGRGRRSLFCLPRNFFNPIKSIALSLLLILISLLHFFHFHQNYFSLSPPILTRAPPPTLSSASHHHMAPPSTFLQQWAFAITTDDWAAAGRIADRSLLFVSGIIDVTWSGSQGRSSRASASVPKPYFFSW